MTIEEFLKHRRVVQFLEYAVGGGLYFVVGFAVFAICYSGFDWPWWVGKMLGDIIGWTLNFLVQRYWAFNNKTLYQNEWPARIKYVLLLAFNLVIDYMIIAVMVDGFDVDAYLALLTSAVFFTAWNYICYRFWVFKGKFLPNPKTAPASES